jgi:hypothetical protein
MIEAQKAKYVVAIAPAAIIDNASATATEIDCKGANYLEIPIQIGATDIAVTALKLQECDTSGGSFTDITGATFSAGNNVDGVALALPSATDDNQPHVFQVNLVGRKRFIKVVCTFGDGTAGGFVAATARLSQVGYLSETMTDRASGGICRV